MLETTSKRCHHADEEMSRKNPKPAAWARLAVPEVGMAGGNMLERFIHNFFSFGSPQSSSGIFSLNINDLSDGILLDCPFGPQSGANSASAANKEKTPGCQQIRQPPPFGIDAKGGRKLGTVSGGTKPSHVTLFSL